MDFSPRAAGELLEGLIAAGDSLAQLSYRGRPVPGTDKREMVTAYPTIIRYRIVRDTGAHPARPSHLASSDEALTVRLPRGYRRRWCRSLRRGPLVPVRTVRASCVILGRLAKGRRAPLGEMCFQVVMRNSRTVIRQGLLHLRAEPSVGRGGVGR